MLRTLGKSNPVVKTKPKANFVKRTQVFKKRKSFRKAEENQAVSGNKVLELVGDKARPGHERPRLVKERTTSLKKVSELFSKNKFSPREVPRTDRGG